MTATWIGSVVGSSIRRKTAAMIRCASGINDKPRGLWRMLRLAEKSGFDALLTEFPDRLAGSVFPT